MDDQQLPKKRRRYKLYHDAGTEVLDVPRQTVFSTQQTTVKNAGTTESICSFDNPPDNPSHSTYDQPCSSHQPAVSSYPPSDGGGSPSGSESPNSSHRDFSRSNSDQSQCSAHQHAVHSNPPDGHGSPSGSDSSDSGSSSTSRSNSTDDAEDEGLDDYAANQDDDMSANASENISDEEMGSNSDREENQNQGVPPPNNHRILFDKLNGEYSERIQDRVAVSRGELLLNLQEFCKQHPQPLTAEEDLHKLINSMFYKEILPSTKYKLDKLYCGNTKIRFFFFCFKCTTSFGELPDYKTIKVKVCENCNQENKVQNLIEANFFIIIEFVDQLQLLLQDEKIASTLKRPQDLVSNDNNIMKDLYDGSEYKKFVGSLSFENGVYYISFSGCTDGTPIFANSSLSIWPMFLSVNEFPPKIRMSNILLGGLWFSKTHPVMDLFLEPFSNYMRELSDPGFSLTISGSVRHYQGYLLAMCVDSGARGSVQGIHTHNGESSCNWCLHPGETEGNGSNARKFLQFEVKPDLRTHEQVVRDGRAVLELPGRNNHINGVLGLSPLLRCPKFDIVNGMVLDSLHWASFGVARRMGTLWLGETKKTKKKDPPTPQDVPMPAYYVGTDETKAVINLRIKKLRPPIEVRRLPRDTFQVHDWNAREWENFILYFSVPCFINILPLPYMRHWILFVQSYYLLMKSKTKKTEIEAVRHFMGKYVDGVLDLYGLKELNFNMHITNHAADNALRWGNAWGITTYSYENGNRSLKSKINAERGIPHQVIRSLHRESALMVLRSESSTASSDDFRRRISRKEIEKSFFAGDVECIMPQEFTPSREEKWNCEQAGLDTNSFTQCRRIIVDRVNYSVDNGLTRTNNSFAQCINGEVVKIKKIVASETTHKVYLFVSKVRLSPHPLLPREPLIPAFTPFMFTVDFIEQGIFLISHETLNTICVKTDIDCQFYKGSFLSVMATTNNIF